MELLIDKGKLKWLIREDCLVVFDNIQATCYSAFWSNPDNLFSGMRRAVLNSKPSEYDNWVEVIGLATEYKVRGQGARIPKLDKVIRIG